MEDVFDNTFYEDYYNVDTVPLSEDEIEEILNYYENIFSMENVNNDVRCQENTKSEGRIL